MSAACQPLPLPSAAAATTTAGSLVGPHNAPQGHSAPAGIDSNPQHLQSAGPGPGQLEHTVRDAGVEADTPENEQTNLVHGKPRRS